MGGAGAAHRQQQAADRPDLQRYWDGHGADWRDAWLTHHRWPIFTFFFCPCAEHTYPLWHAQLRRPYQSVALPRVPPSRLAPYLHAVAAAEGAALARDDVWTLAHWANGDIRAALLALQFWCSGHKATSADVGDAAAGQNGNDSGCS